MTPTRSVISPEDGIESVRRRTPLKSLSTRIVLCVFCSTLTTALIVSWLSVGAIHDDVRARVSSRSTQLLGERVHEIESGHAEASSRLVMAAASGSDWHAAMLAALDSNPLAEDLDWISGAPAAPNSAPGAAVLPAPPETLAQSFDRLSLHRGVRPNHVAPNCISAHVDVVRSASEVAGHLDGCLSQALLYEILQPTNSDLTGMRLLVSDHAGRVAAAVGLRSDARVGELLPLQELFYPQHGSLARYPDDTGNRLVGTIAALGQTGWHLVVESEHARAFAPAIAITRQIFMVDVCIILLFSVIAYKITLAIMQPIEALSIGAQRIAEGHVNYQIPVPRNNDDELGVLTLAFSTMMAKLRSSQLEIEQDRFRLGEKNDELQRANEILSQLSITDGLTKLHNHRYFQDHLTREIKRVSRTRTPLALILLDIDDFKLLNDTHGHAAGDEVLVSLAAIMTDSARESDLIARYGGEEFVILMPNTDLAGAVHLAEKIRMSVESTRLIIGDNMKPVDITISLGVALYHGHRREFFAEADKALYRAKAAGKNCVIIAGPDGGTLA